MAFWPGPFFVLARFAGLAGVAFWAGPCFALAGLAGLAAVAFWAGPCFVLATVAFWPTPFVFTRFAWHGAAFEPKCLQCI